MKDFCRISIYISATLLSIGGIQAQSIRQDAILKARQYYYQGALEEGRQRTQEARMLYEHAYRLDSTNAEIMYALGSRYLADAYSEQARSLLLKAYQSDSLQRDYVMSYAKMLIADGVEQEQGLQMLESWLKRNPNDDDAQQLVGSMYLRTGNYQKAIDLFGSLKQENKSLFSEYLRLSLIRTRLYFALNEQEKAKGELAELIHTFPTETLAKIQTVSILQDNELYTDALMYIKQMEQEGSVSTTALNQMYIRHYRAIADSDAWEKVLRVELEDVGQDAVTKFSNWTAYLSTKSEGDSLPTNYNWVFDRILALHPENTEVKFQYAKILETQGETSQSIDLLLSLSKTAPENEDLWPMLLLRLGNDKRYQEAWEQGKRAEQYVPQDWRIYFYTSISYFLAEHKQEAIQYLQRSLERLEREQVDGYGLSMLYAQLGDMYENLGDRSQVYRAYDKALEHFSDNAETLNNYAYYLALEGKDLEKAERMALRGLKVKADDKNLLDTYAWILYLRGQYSLADLYMRKAIDAAGEDITAVYYEHYGYILLAEGNAEEAEAKWLIAKDLYNKELAEAETSKDKKEVSAKLKKIEQQLKLLTKNKTK